MYTLEHELRFAGNAEMIAWELAGDRSSRQYRRHADIYFKKVSNEQSRYIALHVGLFWCIGTFRIKNTDTVNVMISSKTMFEHLQSGTKANDDFVAVRTEFINKLARQRKLSIRYRLAPPGTASSLLQERQDL